MHSNLKEKRQILRDTVNHIQTIDKEKGTEERKIERAYLQSTYTSTYGKTHTRPFKIHTSVLFKSR